MTRPSPNRAKVEKSPLTVSTPDFEEAKSYALERMRRELPAYLRYHSIDHTQDITVPAAERLAGVLGVNGIDLVLLLTGAYYHDIGYIEQIEGHEQTSIRIASEVLPSFGYSPEQIEIIRGIIQATKMPQSPRTLLEQIMADADMDSLGRDDFIKYSLNLRAERAALGISFSDEAWYRSQLDFLRSHQYFTSAARTLRDEQKEKNITALTQLLAQSHTV